MGLPATLWEALGNVIKMNDKIERMAGTIKEQQTRIEDLTMRIVRLETVIEIAVANQGSRSRPSKRLPQKP